MRTNSQASDTRPEDRLRTLEWTTWSLTVVIVVSLVGGIAAAVIGGALTDLGSGAGGLFGIPSILTTLIALFLAIPAAVGMVRQTRVADWLRAATVTAAGAWIVAIGYFMVAHAVDPCVNGWWDVRSRIGDQPLCERFGADLNVHTRFHLLAHAAPGAILLAIYLWAIRRWAPGSAGPGGTQQTDPIPVDIMTDADVESIDARQFLWERFEDISYFIELEKSSGSRREYRLSGVSNVLEAIRWAESTAEANELFRLYVILDIGDHGTGAIRLM